MERRSNSGLSLWRLSRKFKQGSWDQRLVNDALTGIANARNSRESLRLLRICLATVPLEQLPDSLLESWSNHLLGNRWNSADAHLAALVCTCLLVQKNNENVAALPLALKLRQQAYSSILRKYPAVLQLLALQPQLPKTGTTLEKRVDLSCSLKRRTSTLADYVSANAIKSVAVVGNAPILLKNQYGKKIDSADCVIRFNNVVIEPDIVDSTGTKTDIRVYTPGYKFTRENLQARSQQTPALWLSGYLPYKRPSNYWHHLATHSEATLLESEHRHWLELVQICNAPPTAGLLVLQALAATDCEIQAFGFSSAVKKDTADKGGIDGKRNHYGDKAKRSSRHNWLTESDYLSELGNTRVILHT